MLVPFRRVLDGVVFAAVSAFGVAQVGAALPQMPVVSGTTFSGQAVTLPADLHGRALVMVFGFSKDSQGQLSVWGRRLAAAHANDPSVAYFEAPMMGGVPGLLRGMVLRQIKGSVPERGWPHFLPVVAHESDWKALLKPDDGKLAYVVLCDAQGRVRWQTRGAADDAKVAELERAIAVVKGNRE